MGYPIAECYADGTFVLTKPQGTGGLINAANVAEQIVYEVHDPARYVLPDVVCDFSRVTLEDLGNQRVRVSNARGLPATSSYKASLTYPDGYRCTATLMIVGAEAVQKAQQVAAAILTRTRRLFTARGWSDFRATSVEILGSEAMYGPHGRQPASREVILKIAVAHAEEAPLELFAREIFPAATSMAQGITGFAGGRPAVQPIVRLASCLLPKERVHPQIEIASRGGTHTLAVPPAPPADPASPQPTAEDCRPQPDMAHIIAPESGPCVEVPLLRLAHGRSGDKGDIANIGVLARRAEFVPLLERALTPQVVRGFLAHLVEGEVERYDWPGLNGWNFVLHRALGGGGVASLRYDPQGKSYAQILMELPVSVPRAWLEPAGLLGATA
jgi:hypothetical protein